MPAPELLLVGRIRRAHGIRGELLVEPLTDEPAAVFAAGRRLFAGTHTGEPAPDGGRLTVGRARVVHGGRVIVQFDEIPTRTDAERWRDRYLLAEASALTPPAAGEVYVHELWGMAVVDADDRPLGRVEQVYELPQGLALGVRRDGGEVLLPFREEFIRHVDRAAHRIVATPPEGLFE